VKDTATKRTRSVGNRPHVIHGLNAGRNKSLVALAGRYAVLLLLSPLLTPFALAQDVVATVQLEPATAIGILEDIRSSPATLTVVNFWATWCPPCIEEFPDFVDAQVLFADRGVRVVFVSVDFEEDAADVRSFLADSEWDAGTYIKTGKDQAFVDDFDSPWTGAVPATMMFDREGKLVSFIGRQTNLESLSAEISRVLLRSSN
jgi:thiol-disulfide isomerase/thioredoxin